MTDRLAPPPTFRDDNLYTEHILELPPSAWALFIALSDAYVRSGGNIEVFSQRLDNGRSSMRIRPANVHGHLEIIFENDGHVSDVLWDGFSGPPPREGDRKE